MAKIIILPCVYTLRSHVRCTAYCVHIIHTTYWIYIDTKQHQSIFIFKALLSHWWCDCKALFTILLHSSFSFCLALVIFMPKDIYIFIYVHHSLYIYVHENWKKKTKQKWYRESVVYITISDCHQCEGGLCNICATYSPSPLHTSTTNPIHTSNSYERALIEFTSNQAMPEEYDGRNAKATRKGRFFPCFWECCCCDIVYTMPYIYIHIFILYYYYIFIIMIMYNIMLVRQS